MSNVNLFCFFASYLIALVFEGLRFSGRSPGRRYVRLGFACAGMVAHTAYLVVRSRQANLPPLLGSSFDWMLVLAWIVVAFYLFLSMLDRDLVVGVFLLPLVLLLLSVAYFADPPDQLSSIEPLEVSMKTAVDRWSLLHSTLLVFGITGVISGFVLSLMYLVQHRRLKHYQPLLNSLRLPSLEKLARLNWWSTILSVPLLTLGMLTGFILALVKNRGADSSFSFFEPVVLASTAAWLVMAALFVWLLRTDRPDGKQVASLTIWSCGFLLVTFLLQVLISGGILGMRSFHAASTAVVHRTQFTQPALESPRQRVASHSRPCRGIDCGISLGRSQGGPLS